MVRRRALKLAKDNRGVRFHRTLTVAGHTGRREQCGRNSPVLRSGCEGKVAVKGDVALSSSDHPYGRTP
jgi:hypothetical protein